MVWDVYKLTMNKDFQDDSPVFILDGWVGGW